MRGAAAFAVLALACAPAFAQHLGEREQWQPQVMPADARLGQAVEIEILGRAAVPALELLSEVTGVSLSVAPENLDTVGERKLTLIANGLSLKAIMVQLPEALQECHWDIDPSGDDVVYLLHRNSGVEASTQLEEQDRRAEYEERLRQRRRDSIDDARRALAMSPEELEELEETDLFLARAAQHRLWRKLMEHYASLPEEYLSELVESGDVERAYSELPPTLHEAVCCSLEFQRSYLLWVASQPEKERAPFWQEGGLLEQHLQQLADQIATGPGPDLEVHIRDLGGREVSWGAILSMDLGDLSVGTMMIPARYTRMSFHGNSYEWLLVETGDTKEDARRAVARSREAWFRLRDERQWDESDWVKPSDPRLHERIEIPVEGDKDEGSEYVSILDLQGLIAAETGLSIVSDYFTDAGAGLYPGQQPLGESLWRDLYILGSTGHFEWRLVGDALVFHHTNWPWLTQRELPESLLEEYRARLARQGRFTLDDAIEFALELEARRLPSGRRLPPGRMGFAIPRDLNVAGLGGLGGGRGRGVASPVLFYHSLTPTEQAQAHSPEGLELAKLAAKGRQDLLHYVLVPSTSRDESVRRELARSATFSITESAGEHEGAAYTEYVLTFTFPEDANVSDRVVSSRVFLPGTAPNAQTDSDHGGPDDDGTSPQR